MTDRQEKMQRGEGPERPRSASGLLPEVLNLDDEADDHYENWDTDHADSRRFYVGGFSWLMRTLRSTNVQALLEFREKADATIENETDWGDFPAVWDDELSYNQFRRARAGKAMFFPKGARVLATCEAALRQAIRDGKADPKVTDALEVYARMSLIPAVWNVDDFNEEFLNALEEDDPSLPRKIMRACGQPGVVFIRDLAEGHTLTKKTAAALKSFVDELPHLDRLDLGRLGEVRPYPGKGRLGGKNASDNEKVDGC